MTIKLTFHEYSLTGDIVLKALCFILLDVMVKDCLTITQKFIFLKPSPHALVCAPQQKASAVGYCAHLCPSAVAGDLQAILVSNPKVAAAVAEICMVGLATTAQATKGPPKPDKARIDRLAYVVSESLFLLLKHAESC